MSLISPSRVFGISKDSRLDAISAKPNILHQLYKRGQRAPFAIYKIAWNGETDLYWPVKRDVRYPSFHRSTYLDPKNRISLAQCR
jgi:hypothetical protein